MPLWRWSEIPDTALSSVEPVPRPPGWTGPASKITAWCGATLRRKDSVYLIAAAGGHTDYAGNEVNALVLNQAAPRWAQWIEPSPSSAVLDSVQFYLDKRPSATHTYYATQFIDASDQVLVMASAGAFGAFTPAPPGYPYSGNRRSYSFNVAKREWNAPDHVAQYPGSGDHQACLCVKHPTSEDIYYSRNDSDGWYQWLATENRWFKRSSRSRPTWYAGAAIDPLRNRMLTVGSYTPVPPQVLDLDGNPLAVSFGGLGASALTLSGYPGVLYEPRLDRFLVLANTAAGTIRLWVVHPETWQVSAPPQALNEPAARTNGLLNAAQYVPELRGIVLANSYTGNVLFLRTTA